METDIVVKKDPVIMQVSAYSGIAQKLNFLAQGIQDLKDAENRSVYIECYDKEINEDGEVKTVKTIRLSTDMYIWTEITPYDKFNGELLEKPVAVNLFDLYNITNSCQDEVISFWIDEDDNELVINSYYQPEKDIDELEVRVKINDIGFPKRDVNPPEDTLLTSISLSSLSMISIIKHLNCENKTDGVNFVIKDNKLRFESKYNGFDSVLLLKDFEEQVFMRDVTAYIPFYAFNLMSATGQVSEVKFDIYEDYVTVETEDYDFCFPLDKNEDSFDISDDDTEDYLVIDAKLAEITFELINNLNKPAPISNIKIEKVNQGEADLTCTYEGRYTIYVRTDLAMLSDKEITIDGDIFEELFKVSNVDALRIKTYSNNDTIYAKYETGILTRIMKYNHDQFSKYRQETYEKWKKG